VNKLTKTQRDRMAVVLIATPLVMAALWYLMVQPAQTKLLNTENRVAAMKESLRKAEATMRQGEEIADKLQARTALLAKREATLSPDRDAYAWIISTINPFILPRKGVSIYQYSQPEVGDVGILANFPYRWATFHLKGTGYYHEFGMFFADLENQYPYFRVQNVEVTANNGPGVDPEKLSFHFDLVTPVVATDIK
jgi:hypothetical protein